MKRIITLAVAIVAIVGICSTLAAEEKDFAGTKAQVHRMASPVPGNFQMSAPYRDSIRLHKLTTKETAYWTPYGGKYISDGKYAYLWCAVTVKGNKDFSHQWIAVTDDALEQALDLGNETDGIAFYLLTFDGSQIAFKGYPYSTLQDMAAGIPTEDIPAKALAQ
jgi:hypothetical protein